MKYYFYIEEAVKGGLEKAYDYSIPLLVSALKVKQLRLENKLIKQKMLNQLSVERSQQQGISGYISWLYGRINYSNKLAGIKPDMDMLYFSLVKDYLNQKSDSEDSYDVWARGYFCLDKPYYDTQKDSLIATIPKMSSTNDKLWSQTLLLSAASEHNDVEFYQKVKNEICSLAEEENVNQALKKIPLEDFQGWALSLLLASEVKLFSKNKLTENILGDLSEVIKKDKNPHDIAMIDAYLFNLKEEYNFKSNL